MTTAMNTTESLTPFRLLRYLVLLLGLLAWQACSAGNGDGTGSTAETDEHVDEHADEHEEGEDQAVVELTQAAFDAAGIVVVEVTTEEVPAGPTMASAVPGSVELDPARVVIVSPRTAGRIERLTAVEGDEVQASEPLAYLLSPAFLTAQNDYVHAVRRASVLAGSPDESGAHAVAEAARRRLRLQGADEAMIERLASGEEPLDLLPVPAPFAGSLIEAHALAGEAVAAGSPIFTLADLSVVNVVAEVPEQELAALRIGQPATIELAAFPGAFVEGVVERVKERLDPSTRTAHAVVQVRNPDGRLLPGMFASVRLGPPGGGARETRPVLPSTAVITDGSERYVFVEIAPLTYERRDVVVSTLAEGRLVIRSGLTGGERVVTLGAFTLKSELSEGEFGGHSH